MYKIELSTLNWNPFTQDSSTIECGKAKNLSQLIDVEIKTCVLDDVNNFIIESY